MTTGTLDDYPSMDNVNDADRITICRWWRFLRSPKSENEQMIMDRIAERFKAFGGFTPEISKQLGW